MALSGSATDPWDAAIAAALLATASLGGLAAGGSPQAAAYLGSLAAATELGQLGNQPICADQLMNRLAISERGETDAIGVVNAST